jgi:S1-C subfamily serine protease
LSEPGGGRKPVAAVLIVQTGPRTGQRLRLDADFATLGRHPSSDLQLDPERDLEVSARHAAVFRQGPTFVVRDLGSTNGTWLNGERVRSDEALEPGDRIRLGARGPEVEFTLTTIEHRPPPRMADPDPIAPPHVRPAPGEPAAAPRTVADDPTDTDLKIRMEVARQTDRLRHRIAGVFLVIVVIAASVAGWFLYQASLRRQALAVERTRLIGRVDSLQRGLVSAGEQAAGLRLALDSARMEGEQLRRLVAARGENRDSLVALDSRIEEAVTRHGRLIDAAAFDVADLVEANAPAVVMIFAEFSDGRKVSATGFVARGAGDSGTVVTARHAVTDGAGRPPIRLAVALVGRQGVYRARLVARHDSLDLAALRIYSRIGFPVVTRIEPRRSDPGDPVALVGYPLGLDLPMGSDTTGVALSPTTTTGSVTRVLDGLIQLDGYGAEGASGSPIFGVTGGVIGMLYGGQPGTGGRIIYAVPAAAILKMLEPR